MENARYNWPDIMKGFAFFGIYWAHVQIYLKLDWEIIPFILQVLPIFFFCSGFFIEKAISLSFFQYMKRLFLRLIVPFLFFTVLSLLLFAFTPLPGVSRPGILKGLLMSVVGVRSFVFVPASWFLLAIFCTMTVYYIVRHIIDRITQNASVRKYLLAGVAVILYLSGICSRHFFLSRPVFGIEEFGLPWNFDWGMMFFPYCVAGAYLFPWICNFHFADLTRGKKILWGIICGVSIFYLFCCLTHPNLAKWHQPEAYPHTFLLFFYRTAISVPCLIAMVTISKYLDRPGLLAGVGRDSLIFCCIEPIYLYVRMLLLKFTGIGMTPSTPWDGLVFAMIQVLFTYYVLIPVFKRFLPLACGLPPKEKEA